MEFEYPFMLYLLLFVPLLGFLFWLAVKHNQEMRQRFGDWVVFQKLIPYYAEGRSLWKFGIAITAYILLVFAVANPRMGSRTRKIKRTGVDVYIALDISRSMWAEDIRPKGMDRLEKARLFALDLVEELRGERVGLIFFAGEAFLQMPLTIDYSSAQLFLHDGMGDYNIIQGTALDEVTALVQKTGQSNQEEDQTKVRQKALIIISDGEDHDQKGVNAAKEARQYGITTFTVAVGSNQGAAIPLSRENTPGFHSNKQGEIIKTKVNKDWLRQVAQSGGGAYFDITEGEVAIRKLHKVLGKLEKQEFNEQKFDEYESYYQYLVFIALILMIAEFLISYRKQNPNILEEEEAGNSPTPDKKSILESMDA